MEQLKTSDISVNTVALVFIEYTVALVFTGYCCTGLH